MSEPDYDFLNEEAPDDVVSEIVDTPEVEAETVDVTPTPAVAEVTTTPEPHEEAGLMSALKAEREKRQKYERELAELRQQKEVELPNFFEAPESYTQQVVQSAEQRANQRLFAALEEQARESFPDFDEVLAEVQEAAQTNPAIVQEIFSKANPALAAYKLGKQQREYKAMENPAEYRAKIEAEVRAKLEAEYRAKEDAKRSAIEAIPPELSAARASKDTDVVPDDSLESILKSKR